VCKQNAGAYYALLIVRELDPVTVACKIYAMCKLDCVTNNYAICSMLLHALIIALLADTPTLVIIADAPAQNANLTRDIINKVKNAYLRNKTLQDIVNIIKARRRRILYKLIKGSTRLELEDC
jgi:hypothetical protein